MRIRQVRQEFWTDEKLATLPDAIRLFYVGLWCVADDAGWFRNDVPRLGALLYPYRAKKRREENIGAWTAALAELGRVVLMECGCGRIPTLARHQIVGGKRANGEQERHQREHGVKIVPDNPENRVVSNGKVSNVTLDAREARERYDAELWAGWRRQGLPVEVIQ